MTGRARGKARGRARGESTAQTEAAPPGPSSTTTSEAPRQPQQVMTSGRASHRGGAKGDQRPGGTDELSAKMAAAALSDPQADRKRQMTERYSTPATVMRPDHVTMTEGTLGHPVDIITNFFSLDCAPDWNLYQYRIDFSPTIMSTRLRRALIYSQREILGDVKCFDADTLYLPIRLPNEITEVPYQLSRGDTGMIQIKLTNVLPPSSSQCLHVYNVIFKKILKMIDMKEIGRNYFSPEQKIEIPAHNLEVWPGFTTSILQYEKQVMLCCDVSFKILHTNTVLDAMHHIYEKCNSIESFHTECKSQLIGQIVLTRYNNKTYTIDDIDFSENPLCTFEKKDGTKISYADYMATQYELNISDSEQPVLLSMPRDKERKAGRKEHEIPKPAVLLPEFCTLTGIPDEMRKNFTTMKAIAEHTRLAPDARHDQISRFINRINANEGCANEMKGWKLSFSRELAQLRGRMFPPENISMKRGKFSYKPAFADWSSEMRDQPMLSSVDLNNWIVVVPERAEQQARDLVQTLSRITPRLGMQLREPLLVNAHRGDTQDFVRTLKDNIAPDTQMVVCILPNDRKDRYDSIKKMCCVENAVPSQCVVSRTLSKPKGLMSIATKIAIQLNCKLGGEPWALTIPLKDFMVIGIDSYHNAGKRGGSVGAFVATTNRSLSTFYSKVCFQHNHGELVDGLRACMQSALRHYHQVNGALPQKICIFRDGVGDGQLHSVFNYEMAELMQTFKIAGTSYEPNVSMVICKKRVTSRFFTPAGHYLSNPAPGTIVDTVVTKPEWFDFFLVSQAVRQGTVTPTHYNVILDNMKLGPDKIQKLTYKLTHMYFNWQGTVRVPAPCQYAHKLAFLVGQSLSDKEPRIELCDKLFFL